MTVFRIHDRFGVMVCHDVMVEYMVECLVDVELMDFLDFDKWLVS